MKRMMMRLAVVLLAMAASMQADAQLKNILKNVASEAVGSNSTVSTLTDIAANLLGKDKLSEKNLQGTWNYTEPCVAFESESVLSSIGSSVAGKKAEAALGKQLKKLGFSAGKLTLTLNADSTGTVSLNGKKAEVTWAVSNTDLILTFPLTNKSVHMNAKLTGSTLQLAMSADKLLTLATAITEKASTVSSTLGTVNSLVKNVKGMHVGLKFKK